MKVPPAATEFRTVESNYPPEVVRFIKERPDTYTYQFIIKAFPSTEAGYVAQLGERIKELNVAIGDRDDKIKNLKDEINKILQLKSVRLHRKIEDIKRSYGLDKNE